MTSNLQYISNTKAIYPLLITYFFVLPFGRMLWLPLAIMSAIGLYYLARDIRSKKIVNSHSLLLVVVFLLIWIPSLLSLSKSINIDNTLHFVTFYPLFFFAGYFVYSEFSDGAAVKPILVALLCVFGFWTLTVFWQFFVSDSPFNSALGVHYQGLFSPNPFYSSKLILSVVMVPLSALILSFLIENGFKYSAISYSTLIFFVTVVSGTRSALFSLVFVFLFLLVFYLEKIKFPRSLSAFIFLFSLVFFFLFWGLGITPKTSQALIVFSDLSFQGVDKALSGRLSLWSDALAVGNSSPVFGVGADNFKFAQPMLESPAGQKWGWFSMSEIGGVQHKIGAYHSHQFFLDAWASSGAIGIIALALMYILIFLYTLKMIKNASFILIGAFLCFWSAFLPFNTHNNLYGFWTSAWFWVLFGVLVGLVSRFNCKPVASP